MGTRIRKESPAREFPDAVSRSHAAVVGGTMHFAYRAVMGLWHGERTGKCVEDSFCSVEGRCSWHPVARTLMPGQMGVLFLSLEYMVQVY